MSDIPILFVAVIVVAFILLAPRLRSALRGGTRGSFLAGLQSAFRGGLQSTFRSGLSGVRGRRRGIDVEADLLSACGGDKALMERLIRHESERKPELGRTGAALMALSRLRADRR